MMKDNTLILQYNSILVLTLADAYQHPFSSLFDQGWYPCTNSIANRCIKCLFKRLHYGLLPQYSRTLFYNFLRDPSKTSFVTCAVPRKTSSISECCLQALFATLILHSEYWGSEMASGALFQLSYSAVSPISLRVVNLLCHEPQSSSSTPKGAEHEQGKIFEEKRKGCWVSVPSSASNESG